MTKVADLKTGKVTVVKDDDKSYNSFMKNMMLRTDKKIKKIKSESPKVSLVSLQNEINKLNKCIDSLIDCIRTVEDEDYKRHMSLCDIVRDVSDEDYKRHMSLDERHKSLCNIVKDVVLIQRQRR